MSADDTQSTFDFNDRYGVRPERAWVPYALSFAIIGGIWLVWAGFNRAEPAISYSLVAFNNQDPRNIEIRYTVNRRDSSMPAKCIITARDFNKEVVGQITDLVPATDGAVERSVTIPSRADAVNARVESCYLH